MKMSKKLKQLNTLKSITTLVPLTLVMGLQVAVADRYVTDPREKVLVNRFGECWKSSGGVDRPVPTCGDQVDIDSDGDGVPDSRDLCPNTPAGMSVDENGCPPDEDGDGVPDYLDKCPGTPSGVQVDNDGCPLDSDGDGVPDYLDKCFGTRSGVAVDRFGCEIVGSLTIDLTNDEFDFNSADLKPAMKDALDQLADRIKQSAGTEVVTVIGHTDSSGSEDYNQQLSERRAQATANYLSSQGITDIRVIGRGESQPIADNSTPEGRAQNRRVEVQTK